jgi:hypothetical protein
MVLQLNAHRPPLHGFARRLQDHSTVLQPAVTRFDTEPLHRLRGEMQMDHTIGKRAVEGTKQEGKTASTHQRSQGPQLRVFHTMGHFGVDRGDAFDQRGSRSCPRHRIG